ncbi:MAG TPA: 5-oxoprolinase subunit PxpA [Candidatus Limnocylindrales bacterium]
MTDGRPSIDLNADVGESFGAYRIGEDEALIPLVTSVNVACGFHAGDPLVIERTIRLAIECGAAVGAHPGYPDLEGFGRRALAMASDELEAAVLYQVAAIAGVARALGTELRHVKAHGALYNRAAREESVARPVARAVRRFSRDLVFVGQAGSTMIAVAREQGLAVAEEAFADRGYLPDGSLVPRDRPGAILPGPAETAAQAVSIARDGRVRTVDDGWLELHADTLCLHGDSPAAAARASGVRAALDGAGIAVRAR